MDSIASTPPVSAPAPVSMPARLRSALVMVPAGAGLAAAIAAPLAWVASGFLPYPSPLLLLIAFTGVGAAGGLGIALFREDGVETRQYLPPEERPGAAPGPDAPA